MVDRPVAADRPRSLAGRVVDLYVEYCYNLHIWVRGCSRSL